MALHKVYVKAGKHHPVMVAVGAKKFTTLIKAASFEPKKHLLTHVVFNAVSKHQKVEAEVPIRPRYAEGEDSSPAERATLIVLEQLDVIEVRATPDKIPDALYYDAEKLVHDGDHLTVADLEVPEGVEIDEELFNKPVAAVTTTAALEAANAALAGAETQQPIAETEGTEGEATEAAVEGETAAETNSETEA